MTMITFTIGGSVNFTMTDDVIFHEKYRYLDFSKKKFDKSENKFNYKINDFRVGVAYKFLIILKKPIWITIKLLKDFTKSGVFIFCECDIFATDI